MTNPRKIKFATKLSHLTGGGVVLRRLAAELGIEYKRLCRWVKVGIARPTSKTADDLDKLRAHFGLESVGDLWRPPQDPVALDYGQKVQQLLNSQLPDEERKQLCGLIDSLWHAWGIIVRCFKSEPELANKFLKTHPLKGVVRTAAQAILNGHSPRYCQ